MSTEVALCPLLTCVGNCFYRADCPFKHPEGTIEKTTTELKPKKALKLGGADWKPKEASKADTTATSKPVGKEQEQAGGNKLNKQQLNASAFEFVPGRVNVQDAFEQNINKGGQQYIYGGAQFEENKGPDDDDFDPQDFFEQDYYDDEGPDDGILDTPDYFHVNSKNCSCCHGLINACNGALCQSLGYCHCYAAEIEEEAYRQKRMS